MGQSDTGTEAQAACAKLGRGRVAPDAVWLIGARSLGWGFVGMVPVILFAFMVADLALTGLGSAAPWEQSVICLVAFLAPAAVVVFCAAREARPSKWLWQLALVAMGIALPGALVACLVVCDPGMALVWALSWACTAVAAASAGTILVPVLCKVLRGGPGVPLWCVALCAACGIAVASAVLVFAYRPAASDMGVYSHLWESQLLVLWESPLLVASAVGCSVVISAWRRHRGRAMPR